MNSKYKHSNSKAQLVIPSEMANKFDHLAQLMGVPKSQLYAEYLRRAYRSWFKNDLEYWEEFGNQVEDK
tara:strand:+ start:503 stop:709 length:207 start_codon:yes stop_codon:yes gene_type:complete